MSNRPPEEQQDDLSVVKAIMLKHDWAEVRFMYHNKKLPPLVVSFGQPDEIERLKRDNEVLRSNLKAALDTVQGLDSRATALAIDLDATKDVLRRERGSQPLYRDGMP